MKILSLLTLTFLVSCSSSKVKESDHKSLPRETTKPANKFKEKVLSLNEVKDYYTSNPKVLNPALQDETLDRFTGEEIDKLAGNNDPLVELSILCSKKDFSKAFTVADKTFNQYQKIPAYWNLIANCHLNQGSVRKALLFYNKALEVSPGYVPALNNIGVLFSRQGEDQKALVAFEKANKQSRFAKTPRYNLARSYLSYGLASLALPLFQGLLNESPTDVDLLNAVGSSYFMLSDYQNAFIFYSKIQSANLNRSEIGLNMAITLYKIGKLEDAQKIYNNIEEPKAQALKNYYANIGIQLGVK